jgi:glycosyltransferase involved in cell wall biosynthesis
MRLSLVIPAYNRSAYLPAAIGSILHQSRGDFELIIWDDGSTDGTADAAIAAARDDPRVRVIRAPHRGVCASLNAAARLATGRYIGWVDSDDALAPTALERTAAVLDARPGVGMVYTQYRFMDEDGRLGGIGPQCLIPYSKDAMLVSFMTHHFRLIRRTVFDQIGGIDETMAYAEDYDLCLRLSEVTEIAHIPEPLYFYRRHSNAITSTHRAEQILASQEAVERALVRRGLSNDHELRVELTAQFRLRPKLSVAGWCAGP